MGSVTPGRLFHAVVVAGAALGGCARAAVQEVPMAPADAGEAPVSLATPEDGGPRDAAAPVDAGAPPAKTAAPRPQPQPQPPERRDAGCPPGSERPYPPCYYIR